MKRIAVISLAVALILIPLMGVNCGSDGDTTPPIISGITVSYITSATAKISWATDEPATSNIEYGPDTSYGYSYPSPADTTANATNHSWVLGNLSPDTTYHFRIKSADNAGNEAVSGDYNFTTNITTDTTAPVISDITLSGITETTATISWTTDESATGNIEIGRDTSYGYSRPSPPDTTADKTSHSLTLSGLSPDTVYHFKIKSTDNAGNEAISEDYYFITTSIFGVTTMPATYVNSPDGYRYIANVNGYLAGLDNTTSVSVYFQLGIDTNYSQTSTPVTMTSAGSFTNVFGTGDFNDPTLDPDTTYHFRAVAEMADGTTFYGDDLTFRTNTYPTNPPGQIVQSVTLEQAYGMYEARLSGEEDFVLLQCESYNDEYLQILGTDLNQSPWCAACLAELHLLDRNETYLLYAGVGSSEDTAFNAEEIGMYMEYMGFMEVYFMTPDTVSDWAAAGYPF
ncbi:fibronectin type III domain-containing protein [Chloroflexota bacterium]